MSSLWSQSRSLRNESKIFSATINKSKEPKVPVGIFFDFIKQWWIFISLGSFLFMSAIAIRAYAIKFSGNYSVAIDYVQSYTLSGPYKWITYSIIYFLVGVASIGVPFFLGYRYVQKQKYKENQKVWSILCNIVWNCVLSGFIGGILFIVLFLYYSGLDIIHWGDVIYISRELLITNIPLMFIYIFIYHTQRLGVRVVRKEKYEKVENSIGSDFYTHNYNLPTYFHKESGFYENGKRKGLFIYEFFDSNIRFEVNYKNGKKEGKYSVYRFSKRQNKIVRIYEEGEFANDEKILVTQYYYNRRDELEIKTINFNKFEETL